MSKVYVARFVGPKDEPIYEAVGWSRSLPLTTQFLRQFTMSDAIYKPTIQMFDGSVQEEEFLAAINCDLGTTEISVVTTASGKKICSTERLREVADCIIDQGLDTIFGGPSTIEDDEAMYKTLYADYDYGIIRNEHFCEIMKKFIATVYQKYSYRSLRPYDMIDPLDCLIIEYCIKPMG